ncbi:MAG: inositol monophosphatase, partial [Gemmatimonadetes bacterium]|nr:inositol monophosphatase [Gemmatimonadota bacterium]
MEIPHKQVEALLREASEQKIMPLWQNLRQGDVAEKTPDEIVTIADRSCESFLMDHLPKLMEGSLVLGEESVHENP